RHTRFSRDWSSDVCSSDLRVDLTDKVGQLYPNKQEFKEAWPAVVRGTAIGSALGILPGGGAVLSSFASYTLEKKLSKEPERFGRSEERRVGKEWESRWGIR